MSKIQNILFFTLIICAQIAINTKSLNNNNKHQAANVTMAVKSHVAPQVINETVQNHKVATKEHVTKPKVKVAAPITLSKLSTNSQKQAQKMASMISATHLADHLEHPTGGSTPPTLAPKKNNKLGQVKKVVAKKPAPKKVAKKVVAKKAAPKKVAKKAVAVKKNLRKEPEAKKAAPKKAAVKKVVKKAAPKKAAVKKVVKKAAPKKAAVKKNLRKEPVAKKAAPKKAAVKKVATKKAVTKPVGLPKKQKVTPILN
jgi:DNA polymerase III gamma/tau subunit